MAQCHLGNPMLSYWTESYQGLGFKGLKLEEVWFTICDENEILNTSESSNDITNVVNVPQEPFVFNQDPSENSSQSPPLIDHHCCYGCGDSLDGIFCQRCTCESCGNVAHYGYNCPPQVPIISNPEPCNNQTVDELPQTLPSFNPTCYSGDGSSFTYDSTPNFVDDSPNVFNPPSQPPTYSFPIYYDDDDDEESSIPLRDIIISEPPYEFIKSSAENLVPTPSESKDLSEVINPLSGSTTSPSPNYLLEEFADELALITFPLGNDDLPFNIESDLREIEYLLNHDPTKEMDSILEDSFDESNHADPNNDLVDTIPEMFTDEHTLDYSSPPLYDDVDDDLVELKSDNDDVYDDQFDSKKDKIKESKLLIDELDSARSSSFLPHFLECDSVLYEDFSEVDTLTSTDNEDKVFNPGILVHENLYEVTNQVTPDKNVKKKSSSNASLILEDFNPPLSDHELPFHIEILGSKTLLSFSSKNEEKVFNPGILISKEVHSLLPELSHRDSKAFKVINIFESPMEIFPCSYGEDIRVLDVSCLHFYPP
ncbi:hypothetical protein Tco_0177870 [Tanacetum coccineum]